MSLRRPANTGIRRCVIDSPSTTVKADEMRDPLRHVLTAPELGHFQACVNWHTDDWRKLDDTVGVSGENVMHPRSERERRTDRLSADRFDLAVLTARAFDLNAAFAYLSLAGVSSALINRFAMDYPDKLRATAITSHVQRRRRRTD